MMEIECLECHGSGKVSTVEKFCLKTVELMPQNMISSTNSIKFDVSLCAPKTKILGFVLVGPSTFKTLDVSTSDGNFISKDMTWELMQLARPSFVNKNNTSTTVYMPLSFQSLSSKETPKLEQEFLDILQKHCNIVKMEFKFDQNIDSSKFKLMIKLKYSS